MAGHEAAVIQKKVRTSIQAPFQRLPQSSEPGTYKIGNARFRIRALDGGPGRCITKFSKHRGRDTLEERVEALERRLRLRGMAGP